MGSTCCAVHHFHPAICSVIGVATNQNAAKTVGRHFGTVKALRNCLSLGALLRPNLRLPTKNHRPPARPSGLFSTLLYPCACPPAGSPLELCLGTPGRFSVGT